MSAAAFAAVEPSAAFQDECSQRLPATTVQVQSQPSAVTYDFSLNVAALTRRKKAAGPHGKTLGLTEHRLRLESSWQGQMLFDKKSGLYCSRPQLRMTVAVGPQHVFVGREFPRGSCAFNEIVEHELRHVRANQAQLEAMAQELQQALQESFGNRIFYGSRQELRDAFSRNLTSGWMPWAESRFRQVDAAHDAIDSPAEYARNRTMCDAEVPRLLKQAGY